MKNIRACLEGELILILQKEEEQVLQAKFYDRLLLSF